MPARTYKGKSLESGGGGRFERYKDQNRDKANLGAAEAGQLLTELRDRVVSDYTGRFSPMATKQAMLDWIDACLTRLEEVS